MTFMNKFDVYAIGNALLDIEYHATPQTLSELGIDKGVMTLIDEDRQHALMSQLNNSHEKMTCGGSAANTIIALSQLGAKAHFDCRVSSDDSGQVYVGDLHDSGVHSNLDSKPLPDGITGKCLVFVTPDADRTMNTFLGVSADLDADDVDSEAIRNSGYVYIEGYLASAANARDAGIEARRIAEQSGVKTSMTLSDPNMVRFFRDNLEAMIGERVDLLFANEDEALELAATEDIGTAIEHFKRLSRGFAITRGKEGSLVYDGQTLFEIEPTPVEAIDTLGAGDMFAGAFFYGLSEGMGYDKAGELASRSAARLVTQFGPRLDAADTRAVLNAFKAGN
jgi:sugar/nucleoside kinase (ribokinase family)